MPRDGLQQYAPPPGTQGVANYTVESARYNTFVADITADQNNPRPIVAGGTGAANAHDAMVALGGEIAGQHVDNYDMFPFVAGSFWSSGATAGPAGSGYYSGVCHVFDSDNMVLEAREYVAGVPGRRFSRQKQGGVWLAWQQAAGSVADLDAAYVNVSGDTMTGTLTIAPAAGPAVLNLNPLAGQQGAVTFLSANATKWQLGKQTDDSLFLYDVVGGSYVFNAPSGGTTVTMGKRVNFVGSSHWAFGDAGAGSFYSTSGAADRFFVGTDSTADAWRVYAAGIANNAITVNGANGITNFNANIQVNGQIFSTSIITSANTATTGSYYFGNSGTKYLNYDGTSFNLTGGGLIVSGNVIVNNGSVNTGVLYFGSNGTKYLQYDGTNFNLVGGPLALNYGACYFGTVGSGISLSFDGTNFLFSGARLAATGYLCKQGVGGAWGPNSFDFYYNAGPVQCWIDNSNLGNITLTSDYRIKKDVLDLPSMWDVVKGLRPIKYTQADFTPPAQLDANEKRKAEGQEVAEGPMFRADNIERWGFIAHELQETLIPSASTGVKDSPDHVQSPNPFTVIAALTKALQEAMTRIEALEAR